jgi:conjugative transfer region protein (TIGR03748 family)
MLRSVFALAALAFLSACQTRPERDARASRAGEGTPYSLAGPRPLDYPDVQTGRYSYVKAGPQPQDLDPLQTIVDVRLPSTLSTVGEAADYLLKRSGYCLMEPRPGDRAANHLLERPIPEIHRHLGPMTLQDALLVLAGKAYRLAIDPAYREVGYQAQAGGDAP